jgi:hypothetical protein
MEYQKMGDKDLATFQSEMKILETVRTQEQQGHLSQYMNSLDAQAFQTIWHACSDYKNSSSVLGDLKITDDGQLLFSDPKSGARESFDLAGHNKVEDLAKSAAGGDLQAQKNLIETLKQWTKDGHHSQDDIDWAMHEYTQQLSTQGKLSGSLRGMQVMGVDGAHEKILLADARHGRYAAMDAKSGAVFAASIVGIGGAGFGGMGDGNNPFRQFVKMQNAGGATEEVTEEAVNKAITAGADSVEIGGEQVFSRTVLLEATEGTAAETTATVAASSETVAGALEASSALGESWEAILVIMAL